MAQEDQVTALEVSGAPSLFADTLHHALTAMAHFGSPENHMERMARLLVAAERESAAAFRAHERSRP